MVAKGSIVKVEYEAFTDDGQLFDTTSKDVAKAQSSFREDVVYEPLPVVVGAGRVLPGFDRALSEAPVGEEREVAIPPAEAFGEKDADKFETYPLKNFQKRDVTPYPGMRVQVENRTGTVVSVTPGRVRVDFNHPLAGRGLRYKFKIVEEVTDAEAKVRALVDADYGQGRAEGFGVKAQGDEIVLDLPDSCKYDQRWFVAKYRLVADLRTYGGFKTIRFVESYDTPEAAPAPEPAPEAEAPKEEKPALVEEEML